MMRLIKLEKYNCPSCQMVSNFLNNANVKYKAINVEDNPKVASEYGVMGVPVTILLDDEGNEIQRSIGYKPNELQEMISKLQ
jgi:thioredoxin 1